MLSNKGIELVTGLLSNESIEPNEGVEPVMGVLPNKALNLE